MSAILDRVRSDEHLARRAIGGDVPAFDELYRRYRPGLAAYGARLLGDREGGEDVAQIALFNAYRALARGMEPTNLQAWLYRIARNSAYEVARRRREHPVPDGDGEVARDSQESSAIRGALLDGLRDLPDRQRRTFVLRELHGYSSAEAADELDLTVPQVEQALFAARNRLAERLVFGGRLDCEQLQGLDPSSLDLSERRALRAHSRSCPSCRTTLRRGAVGAVAIPLGLVATVRDALAMTIGGAVAGAPAAVKVGAAVVTAAVATGVPASVPSAAERSSQAAVEAVAEPVRAASSPAIEPEAAVEAPAPEPETVDPAPVEEAAEAPAGPGTHATETVAADDPGSTTGFVPEDVIGSAPEPAPPAETRPAEEPPTETQEPGATKPPEDGTEQTGAEVLGVTPDPGPVEDPASGDDGTACEPEPCATTDPAVTDPSP